MPDLEVTYIDGDSKRIAHMKDACKCLTWYGEPIDEDGKGTFISYAMVSDPCRDATFELKKKSDAK